MIAEIKINTITLPYVTYPTELIFTDMAEHEIVYTNSCFDKGRLMIRRLLKLKKK